MKAWIMLTRPPLTFLGFLAGLATLRMVNGLDSLGILALLVCGIGNMAFNIQNEIQDRDIDKIKKPSKPIPSGQVDVKKAETLYLLLLLLSLILLSTYYYYSLNTLASFLAILCYPLSAFYNIYGKRTGVLGNIVMSSDYGLVIAFLLETKNKLSQYWMFPIGFALLTFAFNICTQYQDIPADKVVGSKTAAMQLGAFSWITTVVASALASFFLNLSIPYSTSATCFVTTAGFVMVAGCSLIFPPESPIVQSTVEWFCRIIGRLCLIFSFFLLLVGV